MGHPGLGGQAGYADPTLQLSWGYVTNHHNMQGDDRRHTSLLLATYQAAQAASQIQKQKAPVFDWTAGVHHHVSRYWVFMIVLLKVEGKYPILSATLWLAEILTMFGQTTT